MKLAKTSSLAIALAFGVGSLLSSAIPANAYPAGQHLTLNLDQSNVLVGGTTIHATVTHAKPGCVVSVRILQTETTSRLLTAGNNGTAGTFNIVTPRAYGFYTIKASTSSACSGSAESDTATLSVGKITTLTASLSTASGLLTVKSKPVFKVTGTLKYGAIKVANVPVLAVITLPNSTKTSKYQTKTNSQGVYAFSMPGVGKTIGAYSATVSFAGSGAYLASSATSNSITLTTPLK